MEEIGPAMCVRAACSQAGVLTTTTTTTTATTPTTRRREETTRLKMNCCTGTKAAKTTSSTSDSPDNNRHRPRQTKLTLPAAVMLLVALSWLAGGARAASDQHWAQRRRHHRRLVVQPDLPTLGARAPAEPLDPDALKVAALAARLEQWFLCRRLGPAAAALPTSDARCPAHFDGHLCWPPEGAAPLLLPCPRLLAAAEEQQQPGDNQSSAQAATPQGQPQAYARRVCRLISAPEVNNESRWEENKGRQAQWELQADYSKCPADDEGNFDPTDKWIKLEDQRDGRLFRELVDQLERLEATIDPYSELDLQQQWTLCIGNIMRHLRTSSTSSSAPPGGAAWCPIIFDGWRCWPSTRSGEVAYVSCPSNQPGFSAERKAHKICTETGQWYKHPMTNRYWSNYTTCVDTVDLAFRTKILNLYVIGNLISLVALAASLIIFISFKSLKCTRVTIHKNLFLSFITNNLMWIIWYTCVVNDADLLQSNPLQCQVWHVLLHYFLVSNYFWMFCEGLYLHTLLVVAFVSEDKILKWFYLLGWLTPVPITLAYAYNRAYDDYYTNFCWMEESPYNLILMAPIGISLLLNLVFLINIVRVLVTKLRANNSPDTHQTRKAVRATLILIPLLGLHYILTPFRPEAKSEWEVIYESVAAVCTSFQGLCVALLFCFCNGEVMAVIKKKLKDTFNLQHSSQAGTTSSEIAQMRARSNTGASLVGSNSLGCPSYQQLASSRPPADALLSTSASCLAPGAGLMDLSGGKSGAPPLPTAVQVNSSLLVLANTNQAYLEELDLGAGTNQPARLGGAAPELVTLLDHKSRNGLVQVRDCPV